MAAADATRGRDPRRVIAGEAARRRGQGDGEPDGELERAQPNATTWAIVDGSACTTAGYAAWNVRSPPAGSTPALASSRTANSGSPDAPSATAPTTPSCARASVVLRAVPRTAVVAPVLTGATCVTLSPMTVPSGGRTARRVDASRPPAGVGKVNIPTAYPRSPGSMTGGIAACNGPEATSASPLRTLKLDVAGT